MFRVPAFGVTARLVAALIFLLFTRAGAEEASVTSPSGKTVLYFDLRDGVPFYRVEFEGDEVIGLSRLGLRFAEGPHLLTGLRVDGIARSSTDTSWTQNWGETKVVVDRHEELAVSLSGRSAEPAGMSVVFRVFDDGIGFRYELPDQKNIGGFVITDEVTEFSLRADDMAWWIPAYRDNRYEYLYTRSRIDEIGAVHTPFTLRTGSGVHMSIHEAALTDWASMTLRSAGEGRLECDLVPWYGGDRVRGRTPAVSPWRTVTISGDAAGLISSNMILNLNEPPDPEMDFSWVEPGKYVGIWWGMHIGKYTWGSGERHGATTARTKEYIDFAARHGFEGVLVEGWNLGWDGNWFADGSGFRFTIPHEDFDIEEVCDYAARRGVYLIGHHETGADIDNYERQLDAAFDYYERLGVRAVKTGYVGSRTSEREWHHGQYMVEHYRKVVETAARHRIMVIVHEPVKATGIRRTWPNMISREGARGQEYNAWSGEGGNPPEHTTILPFTRMLAGPFDFTPGILDLHFEEAGRPRNRVNTTLAKQLALYVVIYSPMQMAADLPSNYEGHPAFEFIENVAVDWERTEVLHAEPGDYVTIARRERGGEEWFLGSITDESGRVLEADLSFLDPGMEYTAVIYADGEDAHWSSAPYSIDIFERTVDSGSTVEIRLAPGGGQAIRFFPSAGASPD